jgi:prepilin-type N-terminal cleavage/methylation domain-containing protein
MANKSFFTNLRVDRGGFSLVEILVAMAVLTIGILGVVPMLSFNIKANISGKNYGIANYLAQQKLEAIRSWPLYEDYDAGNGVFGITMANGPLFAPESLKVGEHFQEFTRSTEVLRNGYDSMGSGTGDCNGIKFETTGVDEGLISGGGSMNTGDVGENCGGNFRGEDFKLIRVRVQWYDNSFGAGPSQKQHEIVRHMYLAKF